MSDPKKVTEFRVLKLVKRDKPAVTPPPVFFDNAPGALCKIGATNARQMGIDAAIATLDSFAKGEHAPI